MAIKRRVEIKLPVELAVKYEYEGSKLNMTLPQYLTHLLTSTESNFTQKKIDEMHKMLSALHDDYFEVD